MAVDGRRRVVLLACGSFNPITDQHLRLFEVARDVLHKTGRFQVIAGVVSPVSDHYGKKDLAAANHRCDMVKLALESSNWIRLDTWEAKQNEWLETVKVLRFQKESFDARYRNGGQSVSDSPDSSAKRRRMNLKNKIISASADDTYDQNDNSDIEVKLLCGADVLESFAVPKLWKQEHMEEIVSKFGMVVCTRNGSNLEKFIYESDLLSQYKNNIVIVTEWITNDISSSKVRRALRRGESVKYLLQDSVIDYIKKNGLYGTVDDNKLMNSFTLSPTDPRSPEPPTQQSANVDSEQGENRQSRGVVALQKPPPPQGRRERDACNNYVLDQGPTRCCSAFLLTNRSSLDSHDGRRQVVPNNAKHANDQKRLLRLSFDGGGKEGKYTSELAGDFTKNAAEINAEKQGGPWSGIKGRSGGRLAEKRGGGENLEREDTLFANLNNNNNNNNNNNMRLRKEDSFDSPLSPENDRSISRGLRNSAGGDSLDSTGRSPVDSSSLPSPQPQKKTITCMVADVFGLVRRIKRLGFSHDARA